MKIGIQGGKGSFNEEAVRHFLDKRHMSAEIAYLYTTEKVLTALDEKQIDMGQFAIQNSTGGMVLESVEAMSRHKFVIVERFEIIISHTLMCLSDVNFGELKRIMAHPQVFTQCRHNLADRYIDLKLVSGEGDMLDTAKAAEALSKGEIERDTAILGSKVLAEIFGFKIIAEDLQDEKDNYTTFLVVR